MSYGKDGQTLGQALHSDAIRRALNQLAGCPEGGWGETVQARSAISDAVPFRSRRTYTITQLIEAALVVRQGRYAWREESEIWSRLGEVRS